MNDERAEKQKARIEALIEKWVRPLGLKWWSINFDFCREKKAHNHGPLWDIPAETSVHYTYMKAITLFYLPTIEQMSDAKVEATFVHELMHIFLNEMRYYNEENGFKHEERVATHLADAFLWLYQSCREKKLAAPSGRVIAQHLLSALKTKIEVAEMAARDKGVIARC